MIFTITEEMMLTCTACDSILCPGAESMRAAGVVYPDVTYSYVSGCVEGFLVEGKTPPKLVEFMEVFDSEACRRALLEKDTIPAVEWEIADEELRGTTRCQGPCGWDYHITLTAWRKLNGQGLICPDCVHPQATKEEETCITSSSG